MDLYETSDIAVASFLKTIGYDLKDVDRTNANRVIFKFKAEKDTKDRVGKFWSYKEQVCPLTFYQKLRELKMVVHCGGPDVS
jgi:hypothetical protein